VANVGSSGSTIQYIILKFANGTVYTLAANQEVSAGGTLSIPSLIPNQNCGGSTCLSKYNSILTSTNTGDSVGVVTSLGNVFWEKPALAVQQQTLGTTVQMTFSASGASNFGTNPVVVVDGTSYTYTQLPMTLTWFVGTQHTYAWQTLPQGTGVRLGETVTGFATAISGTITSTSTGAIAAAIVSQYLLTVSGGSGISVSPASPTGDGYYSSGTSVQITTNYVWSQVAGQSRQDLVSYSLDGVSPVSVVRAGSGTYTTVVTMSQPHTLTFNPVTQYYLTVSGGNGLYYSTASPTADGWYDSGQTLTVSSNWVWNTTAGQSRTAIQNWQLGGVNQNPSRAGSGTLATSIITMNTYHNVKFVSTTQYYLTLATATPSGSVSGLSVGYSYLAATTSVLQTASCGKGYPVSGPCSAILPSAVSTSNQGLLVVYDTAMNSGVGQCISQSSMKPSDTLGSTWTNGGYACEVYTATVWYANPPSNGADTITCPAVSLYSLSCSVSEVRGASTTVSYSGNGGTASTSPSVGSLSWSTGAYVFNPFQASCGGNCAGFDWNNNAPTIPSSSTGFTFPWTFAVCPDGCPSYNYQYGETDIYWNEIGFVASALTLTSSGSVTTSSSTYTVSGSTVTYSYAFSYSFPSGASGRQLQFTLPTGETYASISCGTTTTSGQTVTIGDSAIGSCTSFTVTATASGSGTASQSGSQTADNWFDAGTSATIQATASGPFSFSSWSGSGTIANVNLVTTTVQMSSYYTVTANFNINA
jgi:hypothetical protein